MGGTVGPPERRRPVQGVAGTSRGAGRLALLVLCGLGAGPRMLWPDYSVEHGGLTPNGEKGTGPAPSFLAPPSPRPLPPNGREREQTTPIGKNPAGPQGTDER